MLFDARNFDNTFINDPKHCDDVLSTNSIYFHKMLMQTYT